MRGCCYLGIFSWRSDFGNAGSLNPNIIGSSQGPFLGSGAGPLRNLSHVRTQGRGPSWASYQLTGGRGGVRYRLLGPSVFLAVSPRNP